MNGEWNQMNGQWNQMNGQWNQMNSHQNQKQIGRIVTDFDDNWSKQSPPNTISNSFKYYVKLQLVLMNAHQNKKPIGQNNHLQTLSFLYYVILKRC